ncbi:MAG: Polysaccharide deacetylase [Candidatus Amesbacteria bacterium GW2011_GWA1_48_9]|uniref:Polysaccharide deacetylase n=1 Tax=Candidatus Amesbacteria bacterium GW2011_GWA1_48_9 TaxID=1618355 RepID=A0A0G1XCE5_9BACT|nr:MAG: Polysaccharide deacetylase [Candidatus Amesbacteria bacterium GW2011_GWA1_48_9]
MTVKSNIYQALYRLDLFLRRQPGPLILSYHSLSASGWKYAVPLACFQAHIRLLLSTGWKPVSLGEINRYYSQKLSLPRLCFAVTFDDGFTSVLQAKKFLHRYRIRPALFSARLNHGLTGVRFVLLRGPAGKSAATVSPTRISAA